MQNSYDVSDNRTNFRRKEEAYPGRPVSNAHISHLIRESKSISPKKNTTKTKHRKTSSSSSFQEFQDSTDDAWDIGDDDFCLTDIPILPQVAQSTAMTVISNHSKGNLLLHEKVNKQNPAPDSALPNTDIVGCNLNSDLKSTQIGSKKDAAFKKEQISSEGRSRSAGHLSHGPGIGVRQVRKQSSLFGTQNSSRSGSSERESARLKMFHKLIESQNTDLEELRKLSWSGIPVTVRPITWKLLSGYLPTALERRKSYLERKKEEYMKFVSHYYDNRDEDVHHETYRQIHIDIPRMSPLVPLFQQELVQNAFERILYIMALRHPACGYVQGMNDLVTPFYVVFLHDYIPPDSDVESYDVSKLSHESLDQIEADSYWCMGKLLDSIQDNYTFAQPGIQKKVIVLKELIQRIDAPLHNHLQSHSIEYLQFSFRWMNNLLMRELPLSCTIRLWDTYLSEPNGFNNFHLYVCAAFLKYWSRELLAEKDFQGLMLTLQNLPTLHWGDQEISLLVAEAYKLKFTFDDAPNHLQTSKS